MANVLRWAIYYFIFSFFSCEEAANGGGRFFFSEECCSLFPSAWSSRAVCFCLLASSWCSGKHLAQRQTRFELGTESSRLGFGFLAKHYFFPVSAARCVQYGRCRGNARSSQVLLEKTVVFFLWPQASIFHRIFFRGIRFFNFQSTVQTELDCSSLVARRGNTQVVPENETSEICNRAFM